MKFHSLRTSLAGSAFAFLAAVLLSSCGGGGAASNGTGGNLVFEPVNATFYAGVPATMSIAGGRWPYRLSSSDPGIFPVPSEISANSFTVIPSNPGVFDSTTGAIPGTQAVTVTVIDAENNFQRTQSLQIAQNFLTGYGLQYSSNCAVASGGLTPPPACTGGETRVTLTPTFNGALVGNRTLKIETERGPITWLFPNGQVAGNTITLTTDHEGKALAIFRVDAGVETQFAVFRVTDVETGVSSEQSFIITGVPIATDLTIIPNQFNFAGPLTTTCGTGSAQFLVFDGVPPYKAVSSFGQVVVNPSESDEQPGKFSFNVSDPNICLDKATIIVTDSRLARGTVEITTKAGTGVPPPTPIRAIPTSITLHCATPGPVNVLIVGSTSTSNLGAASADGELTTTGNVGSVTVTWTPTPAGGLTDVGPVVTSTVNVTDGATSTTFSVRRPTDCI